MSIPTSRKSVALSPRLLAAGFAAVAGLALAVAAPLSASAHVTVSPESAEPGSYALITVKVPNESATAVTTRVELAIPADSPFSSVSYVPVPGWDAELIRETLPSPVTVGGNELTEAVTRVVWSAQEGVGISAGQLQLFPVSVGPVPDVGSIVLPARQVYSDGTVVDWDETRADADHPAPVLYVNDAPSSDLHGSATGDDPAHPAPGDADTAVRATDVVARGLGIGALVLGTIGIAAVFAMARRRDRTDA